MDGWMNRLALERAVTGVDVGRLVSDRRESTPSRLYDDAATRAIRRSLHGRSRTNRHQCITVSSSYGPVVPRPFGIVPPAAECRRLAKGARQKESNGHLRRREVEIAHRMADGPAVK
jgi:hypothetical protein